MVRPPFLLAALLLTAAPARAAGPDFNREVRPILSRHCFKCHGPDDRQRQAGLRLDLREGALAARGSRRTIVPGKPDRSELVRRILAQGAAMMPPPAANLPLTEAEKLTLKRWVAAGAEYRQHWAFVAPRPVRIPTVKQQSWVRNPIDAFILARLEKQGLNPSPEADPYTLIRRVTLDLTGLPPTPAEVDAFVRECQAEAGGALGVGPWALGTDPRSTKPSSKTKGLPLTPNAQHLTPGTLRRSAARSVSEKAYERLVTRLLGSPAYGERWARRWLDLARYADTNGYEKDRPRSIWPYRDWVIHALNADLPFDQFTVEQLAGDLLPNATLQQKIATGFHRNTMLNEEGGVDPLEYRFYAMVDRTNTTATAWLGLTVGCAQCHTHKFDPIPHREYYQLMAFLNNADEPEIEVERPETTAKRNELQAVIASREADLRNQFPPSGSLSGSEHLRQKLDAWLAQESARATRWIVARPATAKSNLPLLTVQPDDSVFASGDQSKRDVYDLTFPAPTEPVTAIRVEVLPDSRLPKNGPGRVYYEGPHGDFFLSEVTLTADGASVKLASAAQTFGQAQTSLDGDPQTGWSINGGQGKPNYAVFRLAQPLRGAKELKLSLLFERYHAAGLGRFRVAFTTEQRPAEARVPADVEALLLIPEAQRTPEQHERLLRHFVSTAPELAGAREVIEKLRAQLPAYPTTLVMTERTPDNPRPTFIHRRGEFLQPADRVQPAVLSVLPSLSGSAKTDRLTFARWLVAPQNPLTGRVTVNRQWAAFFGRGIVRTLEDFGYQGEPPTHPALLDWLATAFVRTPTSRREGVGVREYGSIRTASRARPHTPTPPHPHTTPNEASATDYALGWSLKKLHRLIVTSATYRQASAVTPELLAKDPQNLLLARGPRVRLEAELVRDSALRVSGLLSEKIGGPSVFPPQPPGVTSEGTYGPLTWKVSEGEDRYRRGLYTFAKRTAPYAMTQTFDGPSGEACIARREVSNTPLQALTLLNDTVFVEAAQALGKATAARSEPVEARAAELFRRVLARPPAPDELAMLVRFYEAQKARFDSKALNPTLVAGSGDGDPSERAAWTALARSLLNLDEFIVKQ